MSLAERRKIKPTRTDLAALAAFLLLAGVLLVAAFFSDVFPDEAYYYTIPKRMLQGDRIFVEIWQMSQLCGLFLLLPYQLYALLTGGTAGIVLFMRLLFVAVDLAFYVYFYGKLREQKLAGVFAAFFFCSEQLFGILSLNYYNLSLLFVAAAGMILFLQKKPLGAPKLIFAGILLSGAVLSVPGLAAVYVLFTLLVTIRATGKKKGKRILEDYGFVLDFRNWKWTTVGVVLSAAAFLVWLLTASGLGDILASLPGLTSDSEYRLTPLGNAAGLNRIGSAASVFGVVGAVLLALLPAAALAVRKKKPDDVRLKRILLAVSLAVYVFCCATALIREVRHEMRDPNHYFFFIKFCSSGVVPGYVLAFVLMLLCEKKEPRMRAFLVLSAVVSAGADFFSDISLGFGGALAYFPAISYLAELFRELRQEQDPFRSGTSGENGKSKRDNIGKQPRLTGNARLPAALLATLFCLCAVVLFCRQSLQRKLSFIHFPFDYTEHYYGGEGYTDDEIEGLIRKAAEPDTEAPKEDGEVGNEQKEKNEIYRQKTYILRSDYYDATITEYPRGPYAGLYTTKQELKQYFCCLNDLRQVTEGSKKPIYAAGNIPYFYLLSTRPCGSYSSLFVPADNPKRILMYWDLFPEKRPDRIYIPYDDGFTEADAMLDAFLEKLDGSVAQGKAGYILTVNDWNEA